MSKYTNSEYSMNVIPYFSALAKVRPLVETWSVKHIPNAADGKGICPACGGTLTMHRTESVPGYGAQVSANCSTPFCVAIW